ncbi:MAG: NusG domain II-containing protein [Clostridia bacterium]|nr:NusG domain II-containing protein [Clostridia bacterium]
MKKKFFTPLDILIAVIIFAICLSGLVLTFNRGGEKIVIQAEGKIYGEYDLASLSTKSKTVEIKTKYGKNVLEIDCYGADMIYADCENQIDVKHRKITKAGESLVCAPHKVVVYIDGKGGADGVSR